MSSKAEIGAKGEQMAERYLESKGYDIVERNYRYKLAEIDLIVRDNNFLVFVEVKTRSNSSFGYPEEAVNDKKAQKVVEGAEYYIEKNSWDGNIRFDIVAINLGKDSDIKHFEDAFY